MGYWFSLVLVPFWEWFFSHMLWSMLVNFGEILSVVSLLWIYRLSEHNLWKWCQSASFRIHFETVVAPVLWCGTLRFMRIGRWSLPLGLSRVVQSFFFFFFLSPSVGVAIDMFGVEGWSAMVWAPVFRMVRSLSKRTSYSFSPWCPACYSIVYYGHYNRLQGENFW